MKRLYLAIAAVLALALLCAPAIAQASALPQTAFAFASPYYAAQDGGTVATALRGLPADPAADVQYRTGNARVATVNADGVVTGVRAGRTTVTAALTYAGKTSVATASVTVSATRIAVGRTQLTLYVGDTFDLYSAMRPAPANLKTAWSSSRSSVVSMVPMGQYAQLTARAAGVAVITVKLPNGNSARCQVTVKKAAIKIPTSRTLYVGQSYQLSPAIAQGSVRQTVTYYGQNDRIAAVDPSGLITGNSAGSTYVYARLSNGQTAKCRVTVRTVSLSLSSSARTMTVGDELTLNYKLNPPGSTLKPVWKSNNAAVAVVDPSAGAIRALSKGTAYITAQLPGAGSASCKVTVLPESISLSAAKLTLYEEGAAQLIAKVLPIGNPSAIAWRSSKGAVASVDSSGLITAKTAGTAYISARLPSGAGAQCQVTVKPRSVTMPASLGLLPGESRALDIQILPPTSTNQLIKSLRSSNTAIVRVDLATRTVIAGARLGTATVTATLSNGRYATCKVTVRPQPVTGVTLSPATATLVLRETVRVTAGVLPADAANKAVSFASSNTRVATVAPVVGQPGLALVTAVGKGTATITVKTADGGRTAQSVVTVPDAPDYRAVVIAEFTSSKDRAYMQFSEYSAKQVRRALSLSRVNNVPYAITGGNNLNKASIRSAIQAAMNQTTPDDVTVVYLLSHGIGYNGEYRLVLPGWYDNVGNQNYAISSAELIDWLNGAQGHVVLVVNSCNSGGVVNELPKVMSSRHSLANGGLTVLCSSQFGMASAWYNGSVKYDLMSAAFTYALGYDIAAGKALSSLPGDIDKNGVVTTGELERCATLRLAYLRDRYRGTKNYVSGERGAGFPHLTAKVVNPNAIVFKK